MRLVCGNGTYLRGTDGVWRYPWGRPVIGAFDLTLGHLRALGLDREAARDLATANGLALADDERRLGDTNGDGAGPTLAAGDGAEDGADGDDALVLGMMAPELHVELMLVVSDVAELAGVSKATIDSYRYRGYLPDPQAYCSRTPLWARPIIRHWLDHRPGSGWRTDVYGFRERMAPPRRMPISRARRTTGAVDH
jgi:hypothetical protein